MKHTYHIHDWKFLYDSNGSHNAAVDIKDDYSRLVFYCTKCLEFKYISREMVDKRKSK